MAALSVISESATCLWTSKPKAGDNLNASVTCARWSSVGALAIPLGPVAAQPTGPFAPGGYWYLAERGPDFFFALA